VHERYQMRKASELQTYAKRSRGRTCIMPMGPFFFFHPSSYFLTYLVSISSISSLFSVLSPFDPFFFIIAFPTRMAIGSHVPWFAVRLHFKWFLDRPIAGLVVATRFLPTPPSPCGSSTNTLSGVRVELSTCLIVDPPGLMSGQ
jgi:hypothetical protein